MSSLLDFVWVEIPGGTVLMGTPLEEIEDVVERHGDLGLPRHFFAKEAPRREVHVEAFAISRVPVTAGQWTSFAATQGGRTARGDPRLPIDGVAWRQATAFCEFASEVLSQPVTLPSEVQWERAARGGDEREYPWGNEFDRRRANTAELGLGHPLPVGSLPLGASPFGVLDLAGNVDQWTADEYAPYTGAPSEVPEKETWANDPHITRGGSYHHCRDLARCARRHGLYDDADGAGFRVVTVV